jgi:5-methyltetrahydropteroyltriglutamate--homocysteine methyltransferase
MMKLSTDRIITTHVGSLPRDPALSELLIASENGPVDKAKLSSLASAGIEHVVQKQIDSDVDVISDGEQPRVSFMTYVAQRFEGIVALVSARSFRISQVTPTSQPFLPIEE